MRIGIDIGGTNIGMGLLNSKLDMVYKSEMPTEKEKGYQYIRDKLIHAIEDMISRAGELGEKLDSIGIGIPGIADEEGDKVIFCTNLGWSNVPLGRDIRARFQIPVYIGNDATVAAIAESALGASRGYANSLFITIGTGIGGGIILDKKVYSGSHGLGSEIGHMIVGENFYDCNCGNRGCLETFASSTAMERYVRWEIERGFGDSLLLKDIENISAKAIFEGAAKGDRLSNMAVDRMVKYLVIGIANLINILDPDIIVLGGGVARAGDFLLERVRGLLPKYLLFKEMEYGKIELARLGDQAGIIGAAILGDYSQ
ncbi:MAG: ROK family protein [Tissierellaceae bacterium]